MATPASEKCMALVAMVALLTAGFLLLATLGRRGLSETCERTLLLRHIAEFEISAE